MTFWICFQLLLIEINDQHLLTVFVCVGYYNLCQCFSINGFSICLYLRWYPVVHTGPCIFTAWQQDQQHVATSSDGKLGLVGITPSCAFHAIEKALLSILSNLLVFVALHMDSQLRSNIMSYPPVLSSPSWHHQLLPLRFPKDGTCEDHTLV